MQNFHKMKVWQASYGLALDVYGITRLFPRDETYGLVSQLRRSSSSIPTNIAEGCGRHTPLDLARFLSYAMGSSSELETQILLSRDLGYIATADFERLISSLSEVSRMLNSLHRKVVAQKAAAHVASQFKRHSRETTND